MANNAQIDIQEVFPYLRVNDAEAAISFYKTVFGAEEKMRLSEPSGRIGHAELQMGPVILMLADEFPEFGILGPADDYRTGSAIHLHVANADAVVERAVAHGATVIRELQDQFYGERSGAIRDPFGHEWLLGHQIEKVSPEEMQRRYSAMFE